MKSSQQDLTAAAFSNQQAGGVSGYGTTTATLVRELIGPARAAMREACELLLQKQDSDGFWCGELEGDTILESEFILLLAFLGREDTDVARRAARHILQKQLPTGGWSLHPHGALDVNCSVKAYFALKLTGHDTGAEYMRRARTAILDAGGAVGVNSFTRYYLAMLGQIDYELCPAIPPEILLLPLWFPINIYRISAWSRTILVPLSIIWAQRPVRDPGPQFGIRELFVDDPEQWPRLRCVGLDSTRRGLSWERFFYFIDRTQKWLERRNIKPWRERGVEAARDWMTKRFVASDGLGAIFPPIIWSIVALRSLGFDDDSLELRYCHEQLEGLIIRQGETVRLQPCKSPVWDTAITLRALARTGINSSHASVRKSIGWLLSKEVTRRGDWSHTVDVEPSGWFFEHHNDFYPDNDDTAMVLMALGDQFADSLLDDSKAPSGVSFIAAERATGVAGAREQVSLLERAAAACDRGRRWTLALQNRDGGWAAFDRNNNAQFLCRVPFADHNAMIDPSTPDVTARVMEMLAKLGARVGNPAIDAARDYLRRTQNADGSWYGRWGVNNIYGTSLVLTGLQAIGVPADDPAVAAGANWLLSTQQHSGGWGESPASYADPTMSGKGTVTASQTAWALLGLMAAGLTKHSAVVRGLRYLVDTQGDDGGWVETEFTGTGFPRVFYLRYHMYPLYFPLLALAEWLRQMDQAEN